MTEVGRRRLAAEAMPPPLTLVDLEAHAPLLDAIVETPEDPAPWAVYADLLQTNDDPRGELISLMLERERNPSTHLLKLQHKLLLTNNKRLGSSELPPTAITGWRRGFASELRLTTPEHLIAAQRDVMLRLVTSATLVIDGFDDDWLSALNTKRLAWKHLTLEVVAESSFQVAPFLMAMPQLETLWIAFPEAGAVEWDEARAEHLVMLTVSNCDPGDLDVATLPRLATLRLLGSAEASDELQSSLTWSRLRSVVLPVPPTGEPNTFGPTLSVMGALAGPPPQRDPDYDDYDEDGSHETSTAFFIVDQAVNPALIKKLASLTPAEALSARVCTLELAKPVTVFQLFGSANAELLPYRFALALESVLQPTPRIALVEVDRDRAARYLVLGAKQVRATEASPPEAVRRAADLALGYDPGSHLLDELQIALATTPITTLAGSGPVEQLTMVDPSSAPLVMNPEPDDFDEDQDEDEDDHEDSDYDDPYDHEQYEPPLAADDDEDDEEDESRTPVTPRAIAPGVSEMTPQAVTSPDPIRPATFDLREDAAATPGGDERVARSVDDVDFDDASIGEAEPIEEAELSADDVLDGLPPDHDALRPPPYDRPELWLDYSAYWEERAIAADDEDFDTRWPDPAPERAEERAQDLERRIAEPECAGHRIAHEACSWCGTEFCEACEGEDWCSACFAVVVGLTPNQELVTSDSQL